MPECQINIYDVCECHDPVFRELFYHPVRDIIEASLLRFASCLINKADKVFDFYGETVE